MSPALARWKSAGIPHVDGAVDQAGSEHSPNVVWQRGTVSREQRWRSLGHAGATIWLTGLPASGKSTIAGALEQRLIASGLPAYVLDGDNLRHGLNGDLGFDETARRENVRRTAHVARLLAEAGTIAIVSLVSPYAHDREQAASFHAEVELPFVEVFVDAPLKLCEMRDPKGLYARARAGELDGMTGVDAPYEAPADPDLVLRSGQEAMEDAVERVLAALAVRGVHASLGTDVPWWRGAVEAPRAQAPIASTHRSAALPSP
jgi:adenylyl-sulfate kinase